MAELPRCASCRVSITAGQNVVFRPDGRVEHVDCPEVVCPLCSAPVTPHDPIRHDGQALVHGSCWIRRVREASKPPVKMMPEPDGITSGVQAKLAAGTLPRMEVQKVWTGLGTGLACSGCDHTITPTEIEQAVDVNGRSGLRFHRNCLSIWQREVVSPHREIAGGSAASPWTLLFDLHVARRAGRDRAAYEEFRAAIAEAWLMAADTQAHSRRVRAERFRPRRSQV